MSPANPEGTVKVKLTFVLELPAPIEMAEAPVAWMSALLAVIANVMLGA